VTIRRTGERRMTRRPSPSASFVAICCVPPSMRSCCAPLRVLKLRSNVPTVRSSPDAAMKNSTNSSDSSRGSAPKIGRVAARATSMKRCPAGELRRSHVSSDWPSSCAAPGASHGASAPTFSDSEFSCGMASSRSASSARSGGAVPVGPVSEYGMRRPPAR
jgi:hypothetical protein